MPRNVKSKGIKMDIAGGDYIKKIIRIGSNLILNKLGISVEAVERDIDCCQNPVIKELQALILLISHYTKMKRHAGMMQKYGQIALWVMYKDTAYRDQMMWMLYQLLENADKLMPIVKPYVKDPKDWYDNLVYDGQKITEKKRKEGKLPKMGYSEAEQVFVPSIQRKKLQKL
jgi:hypothetical protein